MENKKIWYWILIAVIVIAGGWFFYSKTQPVNPSDLTAGVNNGITASKEACKAKLNICFKGQPGMTDAQISDALSSGYQNCAANCAPFGVPNDNVCTQTTCESRCWGYFNGGGCE